MLFIYFYHKDKIQKPGLHRQQAALYPQLFCQQIDRKSIHWSNELLNMSFHRCSYRNSCFIELVNNSIVLALMICSFKNVLKDLVLDFFCFEGLLLVYIAYPLRFTVIDLVFISKMLLYNQLDTIHLANGNPCKFLSNFPMC